MCYQPCWRLNSNSSYFSESSKSRVDAAAHRCANATDGCANTGGSHSRRASAVASRTNTQWGGNSVRCPGSHWQLGVVPRCHVHVRCAPCTHTRSANTMWPDLNPRRHLEICFKPDLLFINLLFLICLWLWLQSNVSRLVCIWGLLYMLLSISVPDVEIPWGVPMPAMGVPRIQEDSKVAGNCSKSNCSKSKREVKSTFTLQHVEDLVFHPDGNLRSQPQPHRFRQWEFRCPPAGFQCQSCPHHPSV